MLKHYAAGDDEPTVDRSKVVLYLFQFCPFSRRVLLTLEYHKMEHQKIYIDIHKKPGWFLRINQTGKVPMIELDGQKMVDSEMICRFLDQLSADDSLVNNCGEENIYKAKEWHDSIFKSFHAIAFEKEFTDEQKNTFLNALNAFENFDGSAFLNGSVDKMGLCDVLLYPMLELVPMCLERLAAVQEMGPRLAGWMAGMAVVPAVQAVSFSTQQHHDYVTSVLGISS